MTTTQENPAVAQVAEAVQMPEVFTPEELLIKALKGVVDEKGADYVYKPEMRRLPYGCGFREEAAHPLTFKNGEPQDLFGHAFARMGIDLPFPIEGDDAIGVVLEEMNSQAKEKIYSDDFIARCILAQEMQDGHTDWGTVLQRITGE